MTLFITRIGTRWIYARTADRALDNGSHFVHSAVRMFVRFQSAEPSASGRYPGVFALANGLARDGLLTAEEHEWWRRNNDWFEHAYTDPGLADPLIFDRAVHPHTACWFKQESAGHLLERLTGYLALLDKYGVGWVRLLSEDPGRVIYEDDMQIVVWLHA